MAVTIKPNIASTLVAGADLSSSNYIAVKMNSNNFEVVAAGASDIPVGILQNSPASGEAAEVAINGGGAFARAGGTINAGDWLKPDSNGDLVATTTDGDPVIGIALQNAVDNDIFAVLVHTTFYGDSDAKGLVALNCQVPDVSTASSTAYVASPVAGTITAIYSVLGGAITAGDAVLTSNIAGTPITNGAITIANSGSAAGDVDSATPTAANVVSAGSLITVVSDGGSTDAATADITILIQPS